MDFMHSSIRASAITVLFLSGALTAIGARAGQMVKIIDRRDEQSRYTYLVPGHSSSTSNSDVNCFGTDSTINCSGTARTSSTSTPAHPISYEVQGATFTLQLIDGRLAVVNCQSKYKLKGDYINRRSCRMPLVDSVWVDFDGDKAKLEWPVSLDGKKMESETYRILGIIDKP